jgi:hypothetical protein
MSTNQRVAIFVPRGLRTGGPEAMHQLHRSLLEEGKDSVLVPWPGMKNNKPVNEYSMYEPNWSSITRLRKSDIVIVPSDLGYLPFWYFLFIMRKNIFIWMLAVDFSSEKKFKKYETRNYTLNSEWQIVKKRKKWVESISKIVNLDKRKFRKKFLKIKLRIKKSNYLFQSAYAREIFRLENKTNSGVMLTDYISLKQVNKLEGSSFCSCPRNHIAYFPGKSQDLSQLVLEINSSRGNLFHFIPIKNLNSEQVVLLLVKADLFLDLGYFPGKDRLPRESIVLNCPVLLAKRGSARFYEDFQLADKYLLDLALLSPNSTFEVIVKTIAFGKKNNLLAQEVFKNTVLQEREIFKREVLNFISVIEGKSK